jgi:hypothetical protein
MAKATETTPVSSARGRQLQATVAQDVYDAYNEYHWEARKDVVDLVRDALIEFGVKNGFLVSDEEGNVTATPKA